MECNYDPYIQITETTRFPPLRSSPFAKRCEMESLFQQEKYNDRLSRCSVGGRGCLKVNYTRQNAAEGLRSGGGGAGGGGFSRQSAMAQNEDSNRAFHERYSYLKPKAFCLSGPDGSKSLCLNRKEYEAIVERSKHTDSDCVIVCRRSRNDQDFHLDDVCPAVATPSETDCRCLCRCTRDRPTSPVCRPNPCSDRSAGKTGRARAGATKRAALRKNDNWNFSTCLRGSCGRPLKCSSQTLNKIPLRSTAKRLPSEENPWHSSKPPTMSPRSPCGCGCGCCSDVRLRSDRSNGKRLTDSCRSTAAAAAAADTTRISFVDGCCRRELRGAKANRDNLQPPVCCSDSCRTRLRPINPEACHGARPARRYNIYQVRPVDCATLDSCAGICNHCAAGERTFNLSAM